MAQKSTRVRPPGLISTMIDSLPAIMLAIVAGIAIYNPSGYSLYDFVVAIFTDNAGIVEGIEWFYQPIYWGLAVLILSIVGVVIFNWEIAKSEGVFLSIYVLLWLVANGGIIAIAMTYFQTELLTQNWMLWQISPLALSTIVYGAKIPRSRRAYSGAITGGGGGFDETDDDHGHDYDDR